MLPVTALFVVALVAIFQFLSVRIIRLRRGERVAVGDGGIDSLARTIRAQGNLFEYGVIAAGLMALSEASGAPWWVLAPIALVFLGGRISHAYGMSVAELDESGGMERFRWRIRGMMATLTIIPLLAAILLITLVLRLI